MVHACTHSVPSLVSNYNKLVYLKVGNYLATFAIFANTAYWFSKLFTWRHISKSVTVTTKDSNFCHYNNLSLFGSLLTHNGQWLHCATVYVSISPLPMLCCSVSDIRAALQKGGSWTSNLSTVQTTHEGDHDGQHDGQRKIRGFLAYWLTTAVGTSNDRRLINLHETVAVSHATLPIAAI